MRENGEKGRGPGKVKKEGSEEGGRCQQLLSCMLREFVTNPPEIANNHTDGYECTWRVYVFGRREEGRTGRVAIQQDAVYLLSVC